VGRRLRRLTGFDVIPRDEFEGRFGALPAAFPDGVPTVTIDNRDLEQRLTATENP